MKNKCEYLGCNMRATRTLKTKKGLILGRYCEYHYKKVINDLWNTFKKVKKWDNE